MADKNFELLGLREVQKALDKLPKKTKGKILRKANRKQANEVKKALKRKAPENSKSSKIGFKKIRSGKNKGKRKVVKQSIKNNIKTKNSKANLSGVLVGVTNEAYHARFIEKGTTQRKTKGRGKYKSGANRGKVKEDPFIEPTIDRMVPKIINTLNKDYGTIVSKILRSELKTAKRNR